MVENSRKKLEKKNLDMIAANNVKVAGPGSGGHQPADPDHKGPSGGTAPGVQRGGADLLLDAIQARRNR